METPGRPISTPITPGSGARPPDHATVPGLPPRSDQPSSDRAGTVGGGTPAPPDAGRLPAEVEGALADPARRVGNLVILEELGRGGMGIVHRGYDLALRRPVAVKTLLAPAENEQARRRFEREARSAARLRHPAIIAVHEVGCLSDGRPYLVMDLVDGVSLHEATGRGSLAPRRAARIVRELAEALAYAHAEGVVHRDVKPHNVIIDEAGRPHLGDFGIARETREATGITRAGSLLGTPGWAPPEQLRGDLAAIGPPSDVYGAGAVLYHALTGRAPHGGGATMELVLRALHQEPTPPRVHNPAVHADLETIALRCLEKDPAARYPSAADLAADLGRFLDGEPIHARPIGRRERAGRWLRTHRLLASLLTLAVLGALSALVATVDYVRRERRQAALAVQDALVAGARDEARASWERFVGARRAAAEGTAGAPADPATIDRLLALGLEAQASAAALLALAPDAPDARAGAFAAAMAVGELALESEQWSVAASAFQRAGALEVDDDAAARALRDVAAARAARRLRLEASVADALGLARQGALTDRPDAYQEALFTLVRMREPAAVELLVAALDALTERLNASWRAAVLGANRLSPGERSDGLTPIEGLELAIDRAVARGPGEPLDDLARAALKRASLYLEHRERERWRTQDGPTPRRALAVIAGEQTAALGPDGLTTARLCVEALAWIGIADGAIDALGRHLRAEADEDRAAALVVALGRIGGPRAEAWMLLAAERFEWLGPFGRAARRFVSEDVIGATASAGATEEGERPRTAADLRRRASAREASGDLAGALADLTDALDLDPDFIELWNERGSLKKDIGDLDGAIRDLTRAIELAPTWAPPRINRGNAWIHKGDLDRAIADSSAAIEIQPTHWGGWFNRGIARADRGDLEGAISDYDRAVKLAPREAAVWINRGHARIQLGDADGAVADYTNAIELQPGMVLAWSNRAQARAARGDLAGAAADLTRAIEIEPQPGEQLAKLILSRGGLRRRSGELDGAIADFGRVIELYPESAAAWAGRGSAREDKGELEGALADTERAAQLAPGNAIVWNNLGNIRKDLGDARAAIVDYDRALAIDPRLAMAWSNRGNAKDELGDLEGAVADYERAIELEPEMVAPLVNRGAVLLRLGRRDEAIADLRRAIDLDPHHPQAPEIRTQLRALGVRAP